MKVNRFKIAEALTIAIPVYGVLQSIPLVLGWVRPNPYYGIRTAHAFSSTPAWYEANSRGGWIIIAACLVSIVVTIILKKSVVAPIPSLLFRVATFALCLAAGAILSSIAG